MKIGFCPGCGSEIVALLRDEAWVGHRCSQCGESTYPVLRSLTGAREAAQEHERRKLSLLSADQLRSKLVYLAAGLDHAALVRLVMEAVSLPQRDLSATTLSRAQAQREAA
jgi:hypothetical protein